MQPVDGQICRLNPQTSDDLLEIYRLSNSAADFEQIVRRFAALVLCECRRVTGNVYDAEDASQMVFLALAMEIKSGLRIAQPGAWLKRVARRQALKIVRTRTRRRRREDAARRSEIHLVDTDSPIDSAVIAGVIRDEIDQLPERYRLAVILHYFGGMTLELIAQELRITRPAVGTRLHRGRKMLAERLSRQGVRLNEATLTAALGVLVPAAVVGAVLRAATQQPAPVVAGMPVAMRQMLQTITLATAQRPIRVAALAAALALGSSGLGLVTDRKLISIPKIGGENPIEWIWRTLRQKTFHFQISSNVKSTETKPTAATALAGDPKLLPVNESWHWGAEPTYSMEGAGGQTIIDSSPMRGFVVANDSRQIFQAQGSSHFDAVANAVIHQDHIATNLVNGRKQMSRDDGMFLSSGPGRNRSGGNSSVANDVSPSLSKTPMLVSKPQTIADVGAVVINSSRGGGGNIEFAETGSGYTNLSQGGLAVASSYGHGNDLTVVYSSDSAGNGNVSHIAGVSTSTGVNLAPGLPEPGTMMICAGAIALVGRRTRNRKRRN
ncbi:MAG TPA: sigma-70 family RNA polymerase sigma factor [Tepidisphaeraceae bacterium]|jgi:RNA polymerase sigma factor (sigma-70 family)|nr:sigma-70 family RNA polymerase sigma factor [Tepidisphaeraceae bacterium]